MIFSYIVLFINDDFNKDTIFHETKSSILNLIKTLIKEIYIIDFLKNNKLKYM